MKVMCLDCGEKFHKGQRRSEDSLRYKGYYCEECNKKRKDDD